MLVYKILRGHEWAAFEREQIFAGSADDVRDGYIHLSAADQVAGTAAKYFADVVDAVVATVDADALGGDLRWEASRGGLLFPHLYRPLRRDEVVSAAPLPPQSPA